MFFKGTLSTTQEQYLAQIEQDLEGFIRFYEVVDSKMAEEKVELGKYVDSTLNEDGMKISIGPAFEDIGKINNTLSLLYSSVFIALYSFLELRLISTINTFADQKKIVITLSDLKADNEIQKIQKHLEKVIGLDLNDMEAIFKELHDYRKIRNAMIHHGGYVNKEKEGKPLIDKIKQNASLHLAEQYLNADAGHLSIRNSIFIKDFCVFIPKFLGSILSKLYPIGGK